ncbi:trehalose transport-related protein [Purpureocillium lilacinum]|uniref:Trehalose transport-related protein n=1 Tax=Purpureocillium lilacinum TaxID=33203 RepID=A0A179FAR1_PURLI|nr:trehalose transport-related protein [Purpureocillium lilacinum]
MAAPLITVGYETALVPSLFAYEAFQNVYRPRHTKNIGDVPAEWQSGIAIASATSQLLGLYFAPYLVSRIGCPKSTAAALIVAGLVHLVLYWSPSAESRLALSLVGELFLGFPCGIFQAVVLPYVSDITPIRAKECVAAFINCFWLIGQLLAAGLLRGFSDIDDDLWGVRALILIQYAWLVPMTILAALAPESPIFLNRMGRDDDALAMLRHLYRSDPLFNEQNSLAMITIMNSHGVQSSSSTGLLDCF